MVRNIFQLDQLPFDDKEILLSKEAIVETLGVLPYEIIMILRDCYPEGKFFKELKRLVEERLEEWLKSKNKSPTFTDQAIYYQLRKLKDLGLVETSTEKGLDSNDRLITSQNYRLTSLKFQINFADTDHSSTKSFPVSSIHGNNIPSFLVNFNHSAKFNGLIVIGEESKDATFLGPIFYLLSQFFDLLDLSSKVVFDKKLINWSATNGDELFLLSQNLILVGGPRANRVFDATIPNTHKSLHEELPIKFLHPPDSGILIRDSETIIYSSVKSLSAIQVLNNPWNPNNKIVTIGGAKAEGTEALVIELTRSLTKIEDMLAKQQYCLVEALLDSKGHLRDSKIITD